VLIREMTRADLPAFAPILHEVVDAGETYAYPEGLDDDAIASLWLEPAPGRTVVALDDDDTLLGSATMGPNRPRRGSHVGTASFMVASAARGKGVGRALAEDMVTWHRDQGYAAIHFNAVVETNASAVHLWQGLGFRIIGTVPTAFDSRSHGRVGLHVMLLEL
jgi:L-amino acid N-acyltransferase YncA